MFRIDTNIKEVKKDFPEIKLWIRKIKALQFNAESFDKSKLQFFYSYGFFSAKVERNEDYYIKLSEKTSIMKYPERLEYELKKLRVEITIKYKNFTISDRLPKSVVPAFIYSIVCEITKVKMLVESEYHQNKEVIESIPELDKENFDIKIVKENLEDEIEEQELDMDQILEKISKEGMHSLSKEEREFLDRKSKDI